MTVQRFGDPIVKNNQNFIFLFEYQYNTEYIRQYQGNLFLSEYRNGNIAPVYKKMITKS